MRPNPQETAIWSHLLKKSRMENFIFCAVYLEKLTHSVWGRMYFKQIGRQGFNYVLLPFGLIGRILAKVQREEATLLLVTPVWKTQAWFPKAARNEHSKPDPFFKLPRVINESKREVQPLLQNQSLRLVA